ncbi:MAG: ABC-type metal ion transport system, periplasmic component/surface adhesin [Microbacterium sp.]|nr:ABC-type metal ion transport system, periplasmic component/surface adhesin [Microbacterium sp.]MDQ1076694.1 hypothetical protein [Microbacterium sp. SORGH_AS_0969]MDQ1116930.1 hypothetical protein [Microbacterium testaceum]
MKRSSFLVAGAVITGALLAGCAPAADPTPNSDVSASVAPADPQPSASSQALPPTVVSPGDLDGRDVSVIVGTALVIAAPDGTDAEWTGTTADRTIAEFSAGGASEGATFHPGFIARGTGTTDATLSGPDGKEIAFRISVVAP